MQALLFLFLCTEINLICYIFSEHFRPHTNIFLLCTYSYKTDGEEH